MPTYRTYTYVLVMLCDPNGQHLIHADHYCSTTGNAAVSIEQGVVPAQCLGSSCTSDTRVCTIVYAT